MTDFTFYIEKILFELILFSWSGPSQGPRAQVPWTETERNLFLFGIVLFPVSKQHLAIKEIDLSEEVLRSDVLPEEIVTYRDCALLSTQFLVSLQLHSVYL